MDKEINSNEYLSLRDEILKWQERRIVLTQLTITLVLAYIGYMLGNNNEKVINWSWQTISLFPLLLMSITLHMNKIFELHTARAGAFLVVFYESQWEKYVGRISFSKGVFKIGYNKSMSILFLLISISSILVFSERHISSPLFYWPTILFIIFGLLFIITFIALFKLHTNDEKEEFIKEWIKIKNAG